MKGSKFFSQEQGGVINAERWWDNRKNALCMDTHTDRFQLSGLLYIQRAEAEKKERKTNRKRFQVRGHGIETVE